MARLHSYSLSSGTGSQVITVELDPIDMRSMLSLTVFARLTTTDTDAGDICSVALQSTWDARDTVVIWDDRIRLANFTGDQSATAVAIGRRIGLAKDGRLEALDSTALE